MAFQRDTPLLLLGSIVGVILLIGFGTALWAKGGVWRFIGILMVVMRGCALRLLPVHGLLRHGIGLGRLVRFGEQEVEAGLDLTSDCA